MGYRSKCSFDFEGKGVIGIAGANESGKSTLLTAIGYGLFGEIPLKAREVQLLTDGGNEDLIVEVSAKMPWGETIDITRGRTREGKPIVEMSGFRGTPSSVFVEIQRRIKLSFKDFTSLSYFVQGDIHSFMEGDKREYFKRWTSGLSKWEGYENYAKHLIRQHEEEQERVNAKIQELTDLVSNAKSVEFKIATIDSEITDLQNQHVSLLAAIEAHLLKPPPNTPDTEMRGVHAEIKQLDVRLENAKSRRLQKVRILEDVGQGRCPILGIGCVPLAKKGRAQLQAEQDELSEIDTDIGSLILQRKKLAANLKAVSDANKDPYAGKRFGMRTKELQENIRQTMNRIASKHSEKGSLEATIDQVVKARDTLVKLDAERKKLVAEKTAATIVRNMCGRNGIPLTLVDRELQLVEDRCNWVLSKLDYQKRIRFLAYKELAEYEKECSVCGSALWRANLCRKCGSQRIRKRRDEPTITILDRGIERPFALESGGAKVLQSFAVRLACSLFLASMSGTRLNMIILDEVFAMLDSANRQKLMSVVIGKLSSEFGLEQQFVVSHHEDIISAVDHMIVVKKRGGYSTAEWA